VGRPSAVAQFDTMLQSSLLPGLLFHLCSSAHVTRLPVMKRIVSSPESQYERRTSTNTPSTSKMRIFGSAIVFEGGTQEFEQKISSTATCLVHKYFVGSIILGNESNPKNREVASFAM